jgi:hypothetical protein
LCCHFYDHHDDCNMFIVQATGHANNRISGLYLQFTIVPTVTCIVNMFMIIIGNRNMFIEPSIMII